MLQPIMKYILKAITTMYNAMFILKMKGSLENLNVMIN